MKWRWLLLLMLLFGVWTAWQGRAMQRPPGVLVEAVPLQGELPAGTPADRWWALVSRRAEKGCARAARTWWRTVDGEPAMVGRYLGCDGAREEWAGFVHRGRGYIVRSHGVWSEPTRPNIEVQLKSWLFSE